MERTLHYTVAVEIDDNGACLPGDIGEGLQAGIDVMMNEGHMTGRNDTSTLVTGTTVCFSHAENVDGGLVPEIHRVLVMSTGHITFDTNARLLGEHDIGTLYDVLEYGYLIRVPDGDDPEAEATMSEDIRAVIASARSHGCRYVRLDPDGATVDGLPLHEW